MIYYFILAFVAIIIFIFRKGIVRITRTLIGVMSFFMGRRARSTLSIFKIIKPPLIEVQTYEEVISKIKGSKKIMNIHDILPMVETGDIFTFIGRTEKSYQIAIKWITASPVSHIGIVYKNDEGIYLIEADRVGFQKVDLHEIIHKYSRRFPLMIFRKLEYERDDIFHKKFEEFIQDYKNTPYTPMKSAEGKIELIKSALDIRIPLFKHDIFHNLEDVNTLFCSELVAVAYNKLGLLDLDDFLPSNEFTPADFSKINEHVQWGPERERLANLNMGKLGSEYFVHPEIGKNCELTIQS